MHILFKFELKIPPSYPQTTFHYELVIEYSFIIKAEDPRVSTGYGKIYLQF